MKNFSKSFLIIIISAFLLINLVYFLFRIQKPQKENVVFWTLQMSDFSPFINKVISNFEKENPDIRIKWVDVPFSEGEKRTLASVLSDNPPDLVNLNPDFSSILAHKGALTPISKKDLADYKPEIIDSLKINGKYFLIPWYATSGITIYNKNLLKTNVVQTYNDLAKLAPDIKQKTNHYITLPNITENDTMLKILNKYGVSTYEQINSQKSIQIFEMFKNLYNNEYIPKETVTMTLQEALEKYMSQEIVLINAGANFLNMIKENAPEVYKITDVAPQIKGDLGQYDFSLMNFVIPEKSKHKVAALKFAKFITNKDNQLELAKLTNVLVTNNNALEDDFYTKYDNNDLKAKARVISAKQLNSIKPTFKTQKNQKEINNLVNNAVQTILLNKKSTKSALDDVKKQWGKLLD